MTENQDVTPNQISPDGKYLWNGSEWTAISNTTTEVLNWDSFEAPKKSKKKPILIGLGIFVLLVIFAGACSSSTPDPVVNGQTLQQGVNENSPAPVQPEISGAQMWVQGGGPERVLNLLSAATDGAQDVSTAAGNQDADGIISAGNQIAAAADGILSESKVCEDPELAGILRDMGTVLRDTGDAAVAAGNGFNNLDVATIEASTTRIVTNTEKIGPITARFQAWAANNT